MSGKEATVHAVEQFADEDSGVTFTEVIVDSDGMADSACDHYAAAGDDAPPMTGDLAALIDAPGKGCENVVGYVDPNNLPKAAPGEKRIYSRDPVAGLCIAEIWLKGDGSIEIVGPVGSIKMSALGAIELAGPVSIAGDLAVSGSITTAGDLSVTGEATAGGEVTAQAATLTPIALSTHVHQSTTPGNPTGAPQAP